MGCKFMKKKDEEENMEKTENNNKKTNKAKKIWKKIFLFILLIILIFIECFVYKIQKNGGGLSGVVFSVIEKKNVGTLNFLLLGESGKNTDSIMVCSYNPNTQNAAILSIPRDTFIGKYKSKAKASDKINSLYENKGVESVLDAVNDITGLNIENYAVVSTKALVQLVDTIGGVYFDVPIDMKYDDTTQDLHINLKAGYQLIDGNKAEQLLRFRHNNNGTSYSMEYGDNDYGRMRTQREFIKATIKQTCTVGNALKLGQILDIAKQNIDTNMDINKIKDYLPYAVEFNTENLKTEMLPGQSELCNGVWIYVYDSIKSNEVIDELFNSSDSVEESNKVATENNTISSENSLNVSNYKVEVLNGSNSKTILTNVTNKLKKQEYNVTKTGNVNKTAKTTIIAHTQEGKDLADRIKKELGCGIIKNDINSSGLDVTIILGNDYKI